MEAPTKRCGRCKETKPRDEFQRDRSQPDGLQYRCRPCCSAVSQVYRAKHGYDADLRRVRLLKYKYGLTPEDFDAMWARQSGLCAICLSSLARSSRGHCIDHNHSTGDVRALLCHPCNKGIGHLKDSPDVLLRAADYLKSYGYYGPQATQGAPAP